MAVELRATALAGLPLAAPGMDVAAEVMAPGRNAGPRDILGFAQKDRTAKFREACNLPLIRSKVGHMIITRLAVFSPNNRGKGFRLMEAVPTGGRPGIRAATQAHYKE